MKPDEMSQNPTPPRTEGSNPSLSATTYAQDRRSKRSKPADHDQKWQQHFIMPIVKLMSERGVAELHVVLSRDPEGKLTSTSCPLKARFELIPFDEVVAQAVKAPQKPKVFTPSI